MQAELACSEQLKKDLELLQKEYLSKQYKMEAESEEMKNKCVLGKILSQRHKASPEHVCYREAALREQLSSQEAALESARTSLSSLLMENEKLQVEAQDVRNR